MTPAQARAAPARAHGRLRAPGADLRQVVAGSDESEARVAEAQLVAAFQRRRRGDTPSVDVSAVGRAEIDHVPSARAPLERGMAARSGRLVQEQVVAGAGADRDARVAQLVHLRRGRSQSDQPQRIGLAERIRRGHAGEFSGTGNLARRSTILYREAALDRLVDVLEQLIESFTLRSAAGNGRHLGPNSRPLLRRE